MTMPKQLIEVREKLAMDACIVPDNEGEPVQDQWAHDRFCAGFNACFETLALDAGEFCDDEAALYTLTHDFGPLSPRGKLIQMARWQFEQMKARVGLAEMKAQVIEKWWHDAEAKIKALESQLLITNENSRRPVARNPAESACARDIDKGER